MGAIFVDFGSQNGAQNFEWQGPFGLLFGVQKCSSFLSCFGSPLRRPKRAQKAPRGAPQSALRWPKRSPKAPQEAPRGPQETPRAVPEGSKPAQELPNSFPRRPRSFSEAPGSAAVFGQFKKFKSWRQKAPKRLQIADIDEFQRPCLKSQNEKKAGGRR